MPLQELSFLRQFAVLWPGTGTYDMEGQPQVGNPVQIRCRWVDTRSEMMDPAKNTITVDATATVMMPIPMDSLMWLGQLKDLAGTSGPLDQTPDGLMMVKAQNYTVDIKNRVTFRSVGMLRYHGTLPHGKG